MLNFDFNHTQINFDYFNHTKITRFLYIKILIYFNHTKITRLLYVKILIIQKSYIFNTSKKVVRLFLFEKMQ